MAVYVLTLAGTAAAQPAPVNQSAPVVTPSNAVIGTTLTATPGTWSNEDATSQVSYVWERNTGASGWTPIPGATASTYTVTTADTGGLYVAVTVTADSGTVSGTADSEIVKVAAPRAPVNKSRPVITGPGVKNNQMLGDPPRGTLVVSTGTWSQYPSPAFTGRLHFTYQWFRFVKGAWVVIRGATGARYTITSADWGRGVTVEVTAIDNAGVATVYSKNAIGIQPPTVTSVGDPFGDYVKGDPYLISSPASGYCFGTTCVQESAAALLRADGFTQSLTVTRKSKMLIEWIAGVGGHQVILGAERCAFPRPGRYRCRFVLSARGRALLRAGAKLSFAVVGWLQYRAAGSLDTSNSAASAGLNSAHQIEISPVGHLWSGPTPNGF